MPGDSSRERLFLIDGYALIYRAFFAMIARPLTTQRGENTSAAWGVVNFLLRLLQRHRPAYLAWVHDQGESFRHREYPDYKATREKLSLELQQDFDRSVERIVDLLAAFRIPVLGVEGFEADDVIGTLAPQAASLGLQAVIVSGDKDFYQLIGPGIALLNPGRGGPAAVEEQWVDESNASERFGIAPAQVVDYLALVGDSSDNVPGVKGIGEKSAVELLRTYGSLDAMLSRAAEVPGKRAREALLAHADDARLSRDLVTIRRNVPITFDAAAMRVVEPDRAELERLFIELEFRSLIPKLEDLAVPPAGAPPAAPPAVEEAAPAAVVSDVAALAAAIAECRRAPLVAIDTEASSLDPMRARLVGMSLAVSG
ncbi:MAG: 5'-3' exonuclease H3TH domain-containing protein, partial [Gemmatimonadota bacterium]